MSPAKWFAKRKFVLSKTKSNRMKELLVKYGKYAIGTALGAIAGYLYWQQIGCASGTCMITSKPINSTVYGAIMGYLTANILFPTKGSRSKSWGQGIDCLGFIVHVRNAFFVYFCAHYCFSLCRLDFKMGFPFSKFYILVKSIHSINCSHEKIFICRTPLCTFI